MKPVIQMKSDLKLLLNAEPFGFGPTAAIAAFFPLLRERFSYIGYLGKNHTIDLQKNLPYDEICDYSGLSSSEEISVIKSIISQYDIVFTALDFGIAEIAKSLGKKVIIYDPLTWYWKDIPEIITKADLYIAQDFIGVGERTHSNPLQFPRTKIIPPIISRQPKGEDTYVLINLGGLQNPFWSINDAARYAEFAIQSLRKVIPEGENLIITTSSSVAKLLQDPSIKSLDREAMYGILSQTKYAFMTPGLGNIYDAAAFDIPTVWLPAANDSQGQQLELLKQRKMSDASIDWIDICNLDINYFDDQQKVLKQISEAVNDLSGSKIKEKYSEISAKTLNLVEHKGYSSTRLLLETFGSGGEKFIPDLVVDCLEKITM